MGVALGVLALTVVTSVINGFEGELARVITGTNGDVILYTRGEPLRDPDLIESEIYKNAPQVESVSPAFVSELMAVGPKGASGAVLEGVEKERLAVVTQIPQRIVVGRFPEKSDEVSVGSALAEKLGVSPGSELRLIVPFAENIDSSPKALQVRVVGITRMGMYDYDSKFIFMTLLGVQEFLGQQGHVTHFNLKLKAGSDSRKVSDHLGDAFAYPFRAKDWSQLNKNLFYAIRLEKVVIGIILTVIVIVAAFNVVSTLMMMIHDKTKEIAILKAMGFRPDQSFQLFCLIGVGIGAVGILLGVLGGVGLSLILAKTQWIRLPSDIYYIEYLPVVMRWSELALISGVALWIAFLATLYPAWKVSRRSPLEGLRYD